jgi:hypothetical protein
MRILIEILKFFVEGLTRIIRLCTMLCNEIAQMCENNFKILMRNYRFYKENVFTHWLCLLARNGLSLSVSSLSPGFSVRDAVQKMVGMVVRPPARLRWLSLAPQRLS